MRRRALAAALLLLLVVLVVPRAPGAAQELLQEVPLDMAPDAFDDEYRGCAEAMEAELPALNRSEMARNEVYATAWRRARAELSTRRPAGPPALTAAQQTALMAYTMKGPLYGDFNAAVRGAGASRRRYLDAFPFKTLHFLLSRALQVLRAAQRRRCLRAYRGVSGLRFAARPRRPVRFGHFTSCSLSPGDARRFGRDTFFSLETCHGALIHNFSFFPGEEEVLVPPAEVFQVTNVSHSSGSVLIELRSQGLNSSYNCEFLQGTRCKVRPCVFDTGRSSPGGPQHLWVLLLALGALMAAGG